MEKFVSNKNCKLDAALKKELSLPYPFAMKLIKSKEVKVNGKRVSSNVELSVGDSVEVYLPETEKIKPIFENDCIVAVHKPCGTDIENLTKKVRESIGENLVLCHRLDTNTQGIVLFAKSEELFEKIKELFRKKTLTKKYLAAVDGDFKDFGVKEAYLFHDKKKNLSFVSKTPKEGAEKIETEFVSAKKKGDISLVDIRLITGKTHQIRAHLKFLGYNLIGDGKYGSGEVNKRFGLKNQELICYEIDFPKTFESLKSLSEEKIEIKNPENFLKSVNIFK